MAWIVMAWIVMAEIVMACLEELVVGESFDVVCESVVEESEEPTETHEEVDHRRRHHKPKK